MGAALPALLLTNMEGPAGHHVGDSSHKQRGSLVLTLKDRQHPVSCTNTNLTDSWGCFTTSQSPSGRRPKEKTKYSGSGSY